ncbi:Prophage endopeptidase tail [compost metagenome]
MADKNIHIFQEDAINLKTALWGGIAYDANGKPREITGILSKTLWKMGFVDADFLTVFRSFDVSSTTVLDALFQIAEKFNALIVWDSENRIINLYNSENYGLNRGLTLNYGHYLKSISRESRSDEMTTRYIVFGQDDLSIQRVNLTGQNYIEDYSYFMYPFRRDDQHNVIEHSDSGMSDELCHAILDFTEYLKSKENDFALLLDQLKPLQIDLTNKTSELDSLSNDLVIIIKNLDLANYRGESTSQIVIDKTNKENQIKSKQDEITSVTDQINIINAQIQSLKINFQYNNFFTSDLLEELNDYIIEKEWIDTNYTDDAELLATAKKNFEMIKQPKVVINIDMVDFLSVVEAQRDWDKLRLGDTITIRYEKLDIEATAKIIEYSIDHEGHEINLTIANTKELLSDEERLVKLIYSSASAGNTVDINKTKWDGIEGTRSEVRDLLDNVWDATKRSIAASSTNSVEVGNRGIVTSDLNDKMKQVIIQAGQIALTGNGGNTWDTAINSNGVYAKHLVGQILLGQNLRIDASDTNGRRVVSIDGTGMTVDGLALKITGGLPPSQLDPSFKDSLVNLGKDYNGTVIDATNGIVITSSSGKAKTTLNATDGFKFEVKNGTSWDKKLYYNGGTGNLSVDGEVNARALKVQGVDVLTTDFKLKANAIETLEVGRNVIMGPNAVMSWSQISNQPYIPVLPSYIQSTKIGSTYIESPTISAGTINGAVINGGKITSDTTITVGTDATIGNNLQLGDPTDPYATRSIGFGSSAYLNSKWDSGQSVFEFVSNQINLKGNTILNGTVDFTNSTVIGLKIVPVFG